MHEHRISLLVLRFQFFNPKSERAKQSWRNLSPTVALPERRQEWKKEIRKCKLKVERIKYVLTLIYMFALCVFYLMRKMCFYIRNMCVFLNFFLHKKCIFTRKMTVCNKEFCQQWDVLKIWDVFLSDEPFPTRKNFFSIKRLLQNKFLYFSLFRLFAKKAKQLF